MDVVCSISSRPNANHRIPGEREDRPDAVRDRKSPAGKSVLTAIEIVIDVWTRSPASMATPVKPDAMHRQLRAISMAGIQTLEKSEICRCTMKTKVGGLDEAAHHGGVDRS